MMKFTKRQRRWCIALFSFLVFWIAYDIWEYSRHPVFWGLTYLIRVPGRSDLERVRQARFEKEKSAGGGRSEIEMYIDARFAAEDVQRSNMIQKIEAEGFHITSDMTTNICVVESSTD